MDGPGASYVSSRLESGGALSRLVLRAAGRIDNAFAPLPPDVGPKATDFERGGITTLGASLRWLVQHVESQVRDKSGICFLVDDPWSKATDPALDNTSGIVLTLGTSVIHALPGTDFDQAGLRRLFRSVSSFEYSGFLVMRPLTSRSERVGSISNHDIADMVQHVSVIIVSAFDREGLIISDIHCCETTYHSG